MFLTAGVNWAEVMSAWQRKPKADPAPEPPPLPA